MKSFGAYYGGCLLRPRATFDVLAEDPRRLRLGVRALALTAALYTAVYVFLDLGGAHPTSFEPWLPIAAEHYYRYDRFMLAPSMFLAWLMAAGLVQVLTRPLGGGGSFSDTLALLGFAIAIPSLASLAHDLPVSLLGALHVIDAMQHEAAMNAPTPWRTALWIAYSAYFVWFLIVFPKAAGAAQRISTGRAILPGIAGFAAYQLVFLVFNR